MGPGPADGPVVEWVALTPPDPDRLADLLLALGFAGAPALAASGLQRSGGVAITLLPLGEPGRHGVSLGRAPDASIALDGRWGGRQLVLDEVA